MFGTLVVSLPSEHEGGKVVLSHNKDKYEFDSAQFSKSIMGTSFGAWYSDVYHEVHPIKSGYRLVLTYNLVQIPGSLRQRVPDGRAEAHLKEAFEYWDDTLKERRYNCPSYLIHKLDHEYCQESLNLTTLKGKDFSEVQCIQNVCQALDFDVYLAAHEKVVHKDDQAGSEIFDTEDEFKYVNRTDGRITNITPSV